MNHSVDFLQRNCKRNLEGENKTVDKTFIMEFSLFRNKEGIQRLECGIANSTMELSGISEETFFKYGRRRRLPRKTSDEVKFLSQRKNSERNLALNLQKTSLRDSEAV